MTDARRQIQSLIEIAVPNVDIRRGTRSLKQLVKPTENRIAPEEIRYRHRWASDSHSREDGRIMFARAIARPRLENF
jgi:hypothetical protein